MKTIGFFFIIAAMLLIAGCNPKAETGKDLALADSLLKAADDAYNTKDAQIIANLYADDALIIALGKNYWSKDSIYVLFKTMAPMIKSYKSYLGPTTVSTDIVQMQKYYTVELVMGETKLKAKGVGFQIWKKLPDNSWKIVMFVESADMKPY
jgi:ketosteroid isomerase-like protein